MLTAETAQTVTRPGLHRAGKRLFLQVHLSGTKSWIFRYSQAGRIRSMGLGAFPDVTISKAKAKADKQNALLADGRDPLAQRAAEHANAAKVAKAITFREFAPVYIEEQKPGWKSEKHGAQWTATLALYAYPVIGDLALAAITVDHIQAVLRPIWTTKTETATRLRGRIAKILSAAKAKGLREGPNPASWADNLEHLLPKISKSRRVQHFRALPYSDAPAFMTKLRQRDELGAHAMRFVALTLVRTSEARFAAKSEFNLKARLWTIPGARTKTGRDHKVWLCDEAMAILTHVWPLSKDWVFPGARKGKSLSDGALLMLLGRMGYRDKMTTHGLRSTFRDWAAEKTTYPREICERALAHITESEVEKAYLRSDHFEKRKALMTEWAAYLAPKDLGPQQQVVP